MGAMALRRDGAGGWTCRAALLGLSALALAACASAPHGAPGEGATGGAPTSRYAGYKVGKPYQVRGVWYYPQEQPDYDEVGIASWYGEQFHNHYTADGEVFDMTLSSAAHKTLPLPSLVEVTNLANGRRLIVRVNDRGPFVDGRVIDMSRQAAAELGFVAAGVTRVRVRYVGKAPALPGMKDLPDPNAVRQYQASVPRPSFIRPPALQLADVGRVKPPPLAAPPMALPSLPSLPSFAAPAIPAPAVVLAAVEPPAPAIPEVDALLDAADAPADGAPTPVAPIPYAALQAAAAPSSYAQPAPVAAWSSPPPRTATVTQ